LPVEVAGRSTWLSAGSPTTQQLDRGHSPDRTATGRQDKGSAPVPCEWGHCLGRRRQAPLRCRRRPDGLVLSRAVGPEPVPSSRVALRVRAGAKCRCYPRRTLPPNDPGLKWVRRPRHTPDPSGAGRLCPTRVCASPAPPTMPTTRHVRDGGTVSGWAVRVPSTLQMRGRVRHDP
jgi:hypothetical protein